jgi:pimeloyl-ACP methyl ester carboxylesterase
MAKMGSLAFLTVAGNFPEGAPMAGTNHRFVETNGIRMHVAEAGEGPLVILCHGFPECWYSWRHQLPALAAAGYHAVAPDQRGYGETDRPEPIEAYHILHLTADMVGLVHALGKAGRSSSATTGGLPLPGTVPCCGRTFLPVSAC